MTDQFFIRSQGAGRQHFVKRIPLHWRARGNRGLVKREKMGWFTFRTDRASFR